MTVTRKQAFYILLAGIAVVWASCVLFDAPLSEILEGKKVRQQLLAADWSPLSSIHDSISGHRRSWKQLLDWPPLVGRLSPLLILAVPFAPKGRFRDLLLLAGISIMVAFILKGDLKMIFGRDWPVSLDGGDAARIRQHASGFHFFRGFVSLDAEFSGSFPSGHSAIAFAMFLSIGLVFRRMLAICLLLALLESAALVVLNYHFLSDALAGALLGSLCVLSAASVLELPAHASNRSSVGFSGKSKIVV